MKPFFCCANTGFGAFQESISGIEKPKLCVGVWFALRPDRCFHCANPELEVSILARIFDESTSRRSEEMAYRRVKHCFKIAVFLTACVGKDFHDKIGLKRTASP